MNTFGIQFVAVGGIEKENHRGQVISCVLARQSKWRL
jgi:hypothetical protein